MANLLTAIRLLMIVPTALTIALVWIVPPIVPVLLIAIAILTDYFDGKVARQQGTASARGQLFDHTTDFLFVTSTLSGAAYAGLLTPVLPVLIAIAFGQYVLDSYYFYHEKQLHMSVLGRWNGILYFVPVVLIACSRTGPFSAFTEFMTVAVFVIGWLLVLSTALSMLDRAMAPLRFDKLQK